MVRPDNSPVRRTGELCCTELAGESPVAVSAGAPRSRPRASRETWPAEWGVESPFGVIRFQGGEQVRRPSASEPYSLVTETAERSSGRAAHVTAKARDCICQNIRRGAGRSRGMGEGMRTQFSAEQERPVPGGPRWAKAVPISRWRKGTVLGGSPRGS